MASNNPYAFEGSDKAAERLRAAYRTRSVQEALGISIDTAVRLSEWAPAIHRLAGLLSKAGESIRSHERKLSQSREALQTGLNRFGQQGGLAEIATAAAGFTRLLPPLDRSAQLLDTMTNDRSPLPEQVKGQSRTLSGDMQVVLETLPEVAQSVGKIHGAVSSRSGLQEVLEEMASTSRGLRGLNDIVAEGLAAVAGIATVSVATDRTSRDPQVLLLERLVADVQHGARAILAGGRELETLNALGEAEVNLAVERTVAGEVDTAVRGVKTQLSGRGDDIRKIAREGEQSGEFPRGAVGIGNGLSAHARALKVAQANLAQLERRVRQDDVTLETFAGNADELGWQVAKQGKKLDALSEVADRILGPADRICGITHPALNNKRRADSMKDEAHRAIRADVERRIEAADPLIAGVVDLEKFGGLEPRQKEAVIRALVDEEGFALVYGDGGLDMLRSGRVRPRMDDTIRHVADVVASNAAAQEKAPGVLLPITPRELRAEQGQSPEFA